MTDKLVKVARAMAERNEPGIWDRPEGPPDEFWRDGYLQDAKAAIEAHEEALEAQGLVIVPREPTQDMTHLGDPNAEDTYNDFHSTILRACGCPECDKSSHEAFRAIWQAMVSAALEGK